MISSRFPQNKYKKNESFDIKLPVFRRIFINMRRGVICTIWTICSWMHQNVIYLLFQIQYYFDGIKCETTVQILHLPYFQLKSQLLYSQCVIIYLNIQQQYNLRAHFWQNLNPVFAGCMKQKSKKKNGKTKRNNQQTSGMNHEPRTGRFYLY